ncbi:LAQU0S07e02520g1_1 [Lachancea quebecensis]|uniref:Pre-mRNA-splicing factor CWC24 n=1 Tax=Lachancea quebecensis TaxID=1654605 RepID=A0A0P1KZI9_9SACH|nr:LAQU0S07e02520g1_1 [Lachancea quebecensis]
MFKKRAIKRGQASTKRQKVTENDAADLSVCPKDLCVTESIACQVEPSSSQNRIIENGNPKKDAAMDSQQLFSPSKKGFTSSKDEGLIQVETRREERAMSRIGSHPNPVTATNGMGADKKHPSLRTTLYMDYQPDVCKDFKQTGYCGYGDSCKFLHARDDFKSGWKLNQDWKLQLSEEESKELQKIPFKCLICKGDYKNPVMTKCKHYFCSSCFMARAKKTTKCAVCNDDTHGAAKTAKDLQKILKNQSS